MDDVIPQKPITANPRDKSPIRGVHAWRGIWLANLGNMTTAIIKHAPTDLVTAISEIVLNLIKGVIKLTAHQNKRLSRYKKELLALAKKKVPLGKKRKILVQKGGGVVSILVPLALSLLSSKLK